MKIGDHCIYVDPRGNHRAALCTAVHGPNCINVVVVNNDEKQRDDYGRKIERATSVVSRQNQEAQGNYYLET